MATRSVTVLTVHGRRQTVKVDPNMTILQILETVCRKYSFAQDEYDLLHHNKALDLSTMFRFSGLPNNAQLEMAKAKRARTEDADVTVQLQLEDGSRTANGTFRPAQTLLEVLEALCAERATAEAHPVLVYMRCEVYWEQLGTTTLKSLGLTRGRAVLRLLQRRPEEPKTQANVSAPLPVVPAVSVPVPVRPPTSVPSNEPVPQEPAPPPTVPQPEPDVPPAPPEPIVTQPVAVARPLEPAKPRPEARIVVLGERDALLYHASTAERDQADVADSFFELTVPEMMQLYKQLQERVKALEDAPLLTGELRELERNQQLLSNMSRYRQAVIRVQFPDRHVLQGVFQVYESVGHVVEFVRAYLAEPTQSFSLYTTPPKVVLQPSATLLDAGCFPQVLLHFSPDDEGPGASPGCLLRPALLDRLSNATGAAVVAARVKRALPDGGPVDAGTHPAVSFPSGDDAHASGGSAVEPRAGTSAGPANRIPNRNFRQSPSTASPSTSEREAKILKFLKK
uniref:UBX domain-containing protein n=1 Tax=Anopheles dirus TaxID=7168 RepID=A0A182N8G8_9DIPT